MAVFSVSTHSLFRLSMQSVPELARRVCFILCEPAHPGNIGSAARAIKTMGFRDLRVVAPREADYRTHEEALAYATSSADVLETSKSYATLAQALEGVTYAWAMTGYDREFGAPLTPMRQAASGNGFSSLGARRQHCFRFGTERSGLTNEEVCLCQGARRFRQIRPVQVSISLKRCRLLLMRCSSRSSTLAEMPVRFTIGRDALA